MNQSKKIKISDIHNNEIQNKNLGLQSIQDEKLSITFRNTIMDNNNNYNNNNYKYESLKTLKSNKSKYSNNNKNET